MNNFITFCYAALALTLSTNLCLQQVAGQFRLHSDPLLNEAIINRYKPSYEANEMVTEPSCRALPPVVGPKGPKGERGLSGPQGEEGPMGPVGVMGLDGRPGEQGPRGPQGISGVNGTKGDKGEEGGPGPMGMAGQQGQKGDQGVAGVEGAVGPQGTSGKDGLDGKMGPVGPRGEQGADGLQGPAGRMGVNGTKGAAGPQGAQGTPGVNGTNGEKGDAGEKGEKGDMGPMGEKGDPFNSKEIEVKISKLVEDNSKLKEQVAKIMKLLSSQMSLVFSVGSVPIRGGNLITRLPEMSKDFRIELEIVPTKLIRMGPAFKFGNTITNAIHLSENTISVLRFVPGRFVPPKNLHRLKTQLNRPIRVLAKQTVYKNDEYKFEIYIDGILAIEDRGDVSVDKDVPFWSGSELAGGDYNVRGFLRNLSIHKPLFE